MLPPLRPKQSRNCKKAKQICENHLITIGQSRILAELCSCLGRFLYLTVQSSARSLQVCPTDLSGTYFQIDRHRICNLNYKNHLQIESIVLLNSPLWDLQCRCFGGPTEWLLILLLQFHNISFLHAPFCGLLVT